MSKSDFLFLAILACIPVQLGKFFWPKFSYVLGIPIDYLAVTVYLTDILITAYLIFFTVENLLAKGQSLKNLNKKILNLKSFLVVLILFNFYLLIWALIARSPASVYFSFKFLEFSLLSLFAALTLSSDKVRKYSIKIFIFSIIWQSALIFFQFVTQRSLGLWILGERSFDSTTIGIAHAQILGSQLLRPYGTFPHPNVAGAFLVIGLIIIGRQKLLKIITITAIFLTFSKAAVFSLAIYTLSLFQSFKHQLLALLILILLAFWLLTSLPDSQVATISERLLLSQAALDIALANPLFGVGSGNFIIELSKLNLVSLSEVRLLQPVHNIFLLILAENGLIGLFLFVVLLFVVAKSATSGTKLILLTFILIYASFDHFFLTLNQGRLLFWLSISFIISSSKPTSS